VNVGAALLLTKERKQSIFGSGQEAAMPYLLLALVAAVAPIALDLLRLTDVRAATLRATVETAIALLGLIAVWLQHAHFERTRRLSDLLLLAAVGMLALINVSSYALPAVLALRSAGPLAGGTAPGGFLVAATLVAAARVSSRRLVPTGHRHKLMAGAISVLAIASVELVGLVVANEPAGARLGTVLARPFALTLGLAAAGLCGYGAFNLVHRDRCDQAPAGTLLAAATILLAGVLLSDVLLPSIAADRIGPLEALRLGVVAMIALAVLSREFAVRGGLVRAAAIAERRRVARDLHDGLAQDLAFIAAHGARLAERDGAEHPLAIAARRALAISRGTISELASDEGTTANDALQALAHELGDRFEISIDVDAPIEAEVAGAARADAVRIAREAIANAARHGGAETVVVSLRRTPAGVVMRIRDDGCGIALPRTREGFGIRSMRERAATLGGSFTVHRPSAGGTELEVILP
jgi:signal transduction histidine kinase